MKPLIRVQLSAMMFLNFFIWGAWFVTMGTYITKSLTRSATDERLASDVQNGLAYGTQSLGAILAPFIIGLIADRFFSAQKILGVLHLAGAALLYFISTQTNFESFYPLLLGYMILYMPTLALVNSASFRQLSSPEKQFAGLRVFGTVGWIVAGLLIAWFAWESENTLFNTFRMASFASLALGILSFFLPDTPPVAREKKVSVRDILGLDALGLFKDRNFLIFFLSSMLICIPLAFYYQEANKYLNEIGLEDAAGKMTLGQISETVFMLLMPLFFRRFGIKAMLLIGMFAWVLRYVFFSYGNSDDLVSFLYLGIILHGICYDFFFVTGQIYTDKKAGERFKSSAQGLITLATYGVGMLIGFWIAGNVSESYKTILGNGADGKEIVGHDWRKIWLIPAGIAAAVLLLFAILFRERATRKNISEADAEKGLARSPVT